MGVEPNGEGVVLVGAVDDDLVRVTSVWGSGPPAACPVSRESKSARRGTGGRPAGRWRAGPPGTGRAEVFGQPDAGRP